MVISETIAGGIIEYFVGKTLDKAKDFFLSSKKEGLLGFEQKDLPKLFANHYKEVINWSSDIPFIGLSKQKNVAKSTIELSISSKISKYNNNKGKNTDYYSELEILNGESNVLILGKPGAGKTTTIKRLIGHFFSKDSDKINYTNPVLLRLREMGESSNLYTEILDIFSIPWENREIKSVKSVKKTNGDFYDVETTIIRSFLKNSQKTIETFVPIFLNETNTLLFLDGYDELHESLQKKVLNDVEKIGIKLDNSKIILTSRTSSFFKVISNFNIFEINPLSTTDIQQIASKWLENGDDFIKELKKRKYIDLANRPIFLTLLLILFDKNLSLPLSPFEVYREAVFLIIRDWDEHRGINRKSKYANFDVRKKLDFLQEVSLYLTYQLKSNIFSSEQLEDVYKLIHIKYELPAEDMIDVVHEIESHNGLVSEIGFNNFEFSHLSLQEYLCAECLITLPYSKKTILYFFERPDPLAIAVCISKDSGLWLANLLLNSNLNIQNYTDKAKYEKALIKFLSRLVDERPRFNKSVELGLVLFHLIAKFHESLVIWDFIIMLLQFHNTKESLDLTLKHFEITKNRIQNRCLFTRKDVLSSDNFIIVPHKESIGLESWEVIESILLTLYDPMKS